jgi:hypothetical protein
LETKTVDPVAVPAMTRLPDGSDRPLPEIFLGVVVDLSIRGRRLDIDFTHVRSIRLSANLPQHQNELNIAIRNFIRRPGAGGGSQRRKKMRLAIDRPVYIAIRLSDNMDWQYISDHPPFHIPRNGNVGYFFDAVKYKLDNGTVDVSNGEDGIQLAVVKYYPKMDTQTPPHAIDYDDRFNINTECWLDDHAGNDQKIPIIIDPEVGWPTGTKP